MIKGQKVKENNMSNYVISCCSTADLTREHMLERNIKYACFHYELDGKEYMDDLGQSMPLPDFYKAMEAGACHDKDLADQSGGVHGVLQTVSG